MLCGSASANIIHARPARNFILELSKHGLTKRRTSSSNLNFFMNVPIDPRGNFTVVDGIFRGRKLCRPHAYIDLDFVISNCPQVEHPCTDLIRPRFGC